jgi:hypothetical protein
MSYIILRGCCCSVIVLNVHAQIGDKIDVKESCNKRLEYVLDKVLKYHMNIFVKSFHCQSKQGRHFQTSNRNESLNKMSNDNGVRVVSFAGPKILMVRTTMLPQPNICKYT